MGVRHLGALTVAACFTVCLVTAAASAAAVNDVSEHVAVRAYQRYVTALVTNMTAGRQSEEALVSSVSAACPNVLAAAGLLPESSVNAGTVAAFGEEVGYDVALAAVVPDRVPLAALARTLSKLRWSPRRLDMKISSSLAAQRRFFLLEPSDLCADARAIAVTNVQVTPPATLGFLATVGRYKSSAGLSVLTDTLRRFQTRADRGVIVAIGRLQSRSASRFEALTIAEVHKLLAALGLPS